MISCFLSLGSNVGNRLDNIRRAVWLLGVSNRIASKSGVYETPPWGVESQPRFLNCCVGIETERQAAELLGDVKRMERDIGREARGKWEAREIDIDILTYGNLKIETPELTIPHPFMRERAFALVPLRDIAPDFEFPDSGESIDCLLEKIGRGGIVRITAL